MSTWVDTAKHELATDTRTLIAYRKTLDTTKLHAAVESDMVGEMISDMHFALECIRRGHIPGNRRGVHQRGVYQRTELASMLPNLVPNVTELTNDEKRKIIDVLVSLSNRERSCFLMHVTKGLTEKDISVRLDVSERAVRSYIDRAEKKVACMRESATIKRKLSLP